MPCIPGAVREQAPTSYLDYGFDWGPTLGAGETIAQSTWEAAPTNTAPPLQFSNAGVATNGGTVVWISGGRLNTDYEVTNRITTSSVPARQDSRSFILQIREVLV